MHRARCALSHPQAMWVTSRERKFPHFPCATYGCPSVRWAPATPDHSPAPTEKKNAPGGLTHTKGVPVCQPTWTNPGWVQAPQGRVLCPDWREFAMSATTSCTIQMLPSSHIPLCTFANCHAAFSPLFKLPFASEDSHSLVTIQSGWWSSFPLAK